MINYYLPERFVKTSEKSYNYAITKNQWIDYSFKIFHILEVFLFEVVKDVPNVQYINAVPQDDEYKDVDALFCKEFYSNVGVTNGLLVETFEG